MQDVLSQCRTLGTLHQKCCCTPKAIDVQVHADAMSRAPCCDGVELANAAIPPSTSMAAPFALDAPVLFVASLVPVLVVDEANVTVERDLPRVSTGPPLHIK